jgi:hypothetical protein
MASFAHWMDVFARIDASPGSSRPKIETVTRSGTLMPD